MANEELTEEHRELLVRANEVGISTLGYAVPGARLDRLREMIEEAEAPDLDDEEDFEDEELADDLRFGDQLDDNPIDHKASAEELLARARDPEASDEDRSLGLKTAHVHAVLHVADVIAEATVERELDMFSEALDAAIEEHPVVQPSDDEMDDDEDEEKPDE